MSDSIVLSPSKLSSQRVNEINDLDWGSAELESMLSDERISLQSPRETSGHSRRRRRQSIAGACTTKDPSTPTGRRRNNRRGRRHSIGAEGVGGGSNHQCRRRSSATLDTEPTDSERSERITIPSEIVIDSSPRSPSLSSHTRRAFAAMSARLKSPNSKLAKLPN